MSAKNHENWLTVYKIITITKRVTNFWRIRYSTVTFEEQITNVIQQNVVYS